MTAGRAADISARVHRYCSMGNYYLVGIENNCCELSLFLIVASFSLTLCQILVQDHLIPNPCKDPVIL